MSSIFEFIPTDSTAEHDTPTEFMGALPPFVRVSFRDAAEEHWSDFQVEITHQEMRERSNLTSIAKAQTKLNHQKIS
jgi:hypothetical protein